MNVISYEMAYSLYPKATFEERTSLISGHSFQDSKKDAHEKYRVRGWDVEQEFSESDLETVYHTQAFRWIGDKHCWSIPLDTSFITNRIPLAKGSNPMIRDPIVISNWVLFYSERKGADINAVVYSDPNLACSYVADSDYRFFRLYRGRLRMGLGGHKRTECVHRWAVLLFD